MKQDALVAGCIVIFVLGAVGYLFDVLITNQNEAIPQIQACFDAGGEPVVTPLNKFIACRGREVK